MGWNLEENNNLGNLEIMDEFINNSDSPQHFLGLTTAHISYEESPAVRGSVHPGAEDGRERTRSRWRLPSLSSSHHLLASNDQRVSQTRTEPKLLALALASASEHSCIDAHNRPAERRTDAGHFGSDVVVMYGPTDFRSCSPQRCSVVNGILAQYKR